MNSATEYRSTDSLIWAIAPNSNYAIATPLPL